MTFDMSFDADIQYQDAASRQLLRAGQLQPCASKSEWS